MKKKRTRSKTKGQLRRELSRVKAQLIRVQGASARDIGRITRERNDMASRRAAALIEADQNHLHVVNLSKQLNEAQAALRQLRADHARVLEAMRNTRHTR